MLFIGRNQNYFEKMITSSDGETIKELKHQISDNNLNYIGLFKMPGEEWRCLAVAVITKHDTNVQNSLAFVEFDENLEITGENVCEFGDDYTSMSVVCDRKNKLKGVFKTKGAVNNFLNNMTNNHIIDNQYLISNRTKPHTFFLDKNPLSS